MIVKRKSQLRDIEEVLEEIGLREKEKERIKSHREDYPSEKAYQLDLKYINEDLEDLRAELGYLQAKKNTL